MPRTDIPPTLSSDIKPSFNWELNLELNVSISSRPVNELPGWHGHAMVTMSENLYDNQQ